MGRRLMKLGMLPSLFVPRSVGVSANGLVRLGGSGGVKETLDGGE